MSDFPYTQVTGKLKTIFDKIQSLGIPNVVDKKWLASIGLTTKNDLSIISVLKFIDFVDPSGKPIDRWSAYRDKSRAGKVLADGIMKGYADVFSVYPDAFQRNDDELRAYFSSRMSSSGLVISRTIYTFKTLCGLAKFESAPVVETPSDKPAVKKNNDTQTKPEQIFEKGIGAGFTININIQLTLPATSDESVYDKLFASMKKNLLS